MTMRSRGERHGNFPDGYSRRMADPPVLITGTTRQDGSDLAGFLLPKRHNALPEGA